MVFLNRSLICLLSLFFSLSFSFSMEVGNQGDQEIRMGTLSEAEKQVFDQEKTDPHSLLKRLYEESTLLALGESHHSGYQAYDNLYRLLEEIGTDPRLKYIATESCSRGRAFLRLASTQRKLEEIPQWVMENKYYEYYNLVFQPLIRKINKSRDPGNPLIIVPIDGYHLIQARPTLSWPLSRSWDRENLTKEQFIEHVLNQLEKGQKAIIFYHLGHLIQGLRAQLPRVTEGLQWDTSVFTPMNWLSLFLEEKPEWRSKMKIVAFEERDPSWAPNGVFSLGQRMMKANEDQPFGVSLAKFGEVSTERGLDVIQTGSKLKEHFFLDPSNTDSISKMVDALIGLPKVKAKDLRILTDVITFEGIVALNHCSGSLVRFETSKGTDRAMVLSNGHCIESGFLAPDEVKYMIPASREFKLRRKDGMESLGMLQADQLIYATMTKTDLSLYRLRQTYDEIDDLYEVQALTLASERPKVGTRISILSGALSSQNKCDIDLIVNELREGQWTFKDSIRFTSHIGERENDCQMKPLSSGSPLVDRETREVVGVSNTMNNSSGVACTEDNPCEVDAEGNISSSPTGTLYGQQTFWLYGCLNADNHLDLKKPGCELPH